MGLGKSLSIISLIAANQYSKAEDSLVAGITPVKSTILVVPLPRKIVHIIALNTLTRPQSYKHGRRNFQRQFFNRWKLLNISELCWRSSELGLTSERHLHPRSLSWCKFHGPRKQLVQELGNFDIVITTYKVSQILGAELPISDVSRVLSSQDMSRE